MVYADTNFFVGLMNTTDALYRAARKVYRQHRGDIQTSVLTVAELLAGCEKYGTDPEVMVGSVFQLADVSGISLAQAMKAAHYMKEMKLSAFDALHCAIAGNKIISADKDLDSTGVRRIWIR